jgi:CBS domain containing-hemolysin-like protein
VVGDISGIISGTTAAVLAARLVAGFSFNAILVPLVLSGVVAGTTIGGKAAGKTFGMKHNTQIVLHVGKVLHFFHLSRGRNGGKRPRR